MGLRQIKDFSKSFLANEWWRWGDNSTRRPGSEVGGDANGSWRRCQWGRTVGKGGRMDSLGGLRSFTMGPAIDTDRREKDQRIFC